MLSESGQDELSGVHSLQQLTTKHSPDPLPLASGKFVVLHQCDNPRKAPRDFPFTKHWKVLEIRCYTNKRHPVFETEAQKLEVLNAGTRSFMAQKPCTRLATALIHPSISNPQSQPSLLLSMRDVSPRMS